MSNDEFRALMDSVGEMALTAARGIASHIRIVGDPTSQTACVTALTDKKLSDDEYMALMGKLVSISEFYIAELSLTYDIDELISSEPHDFDRSSKFCEFAYSG